MINQMILGEEDLSNEMISFDQYFINQDKN
jgi:hypothetical protein